MRKLYKSMPEPHQDPLTVHCYENLWHNSLRDNRTLRAKLKSAREEVRYLNKKIHKATTYLEEG